MADWKQELRNVLAEAQYERAAWTITLTDERMKELEAMNLWTMERMND
jgi:hypothetical protein